MCRGPMVGKGRRAGGLRSYLSEGCVCTADLRRVSAGPPHLVRAQRAKGTLGVLCRVPDGFVRPQVALGLLPAPADGPREPNPSQGQDFKVASEQTSSLCVRVKFLCVPSVTAHSGCWAVRADSGLGLSPALVRMCLPGALAAPWASGAHFRYLYNWFAASCSSSPVPGQLCGQLAGITSACTEVHCTARLGRAPAPAAGLGLAVLPAPW